MTNTTAGHSAEYAATYAASIAAGTCEHDARWNAACAELQAERAEQPDTAPLAHLTDGELRTLSANGAITDADIDAARGLLSTAPADVLEQTIANMTAARELGDAAYAELNRRAAERAARAPRLLYDQYGRVVGTAR